MFGAKDGVRYDQIHLGYILIGAVFLIEGWLLTTIMNFGLTIFHMIGTVIVFALLLCVYCIRVTVDRDTLYISWGIGFFRKEIALSDIDKFQIENNRYLLSWLYNPFGEQVLRVNLRFGGHSTIPTFSAKDLQRVLQIRV